MATFIGVDVSKYQGDIDYDQLKNSVSFVLYKGTGADAGLYADTEFLRNHAEARRTNMHRGIYHFGGGNADATIEAHYFFQQCLTNLLPGEVVALDAEYGYSLRPEWCLTFLQTLENLIGFKPMLYINEGQLQSQDWSAVAAANFGLWLADWTGDPNVIVQMKYWGFCALQQFTDKGHVAGIAGAVDEDGFFANDMNFFDRYGKPAPAESPAPAASAPVETVPPVVETPADPIPAVTPPIIAPEIPNTTVDPTPLPKPFEQPPVSSQPVLPPVTPIVVVSPLKPWYILLLEAIKRFFHIKV